VSNWQVRDRRESAARRLDEAPELLAAIGQDGAERRPVLGDPAMGRNRSDVLT
jgi:hypothetical protein